MKSEPQTVGEVCPFILKYALSCWSMPLHAEVCPFILK